MLLTGAATVTQGRWPQTDYTGVEGGRARLHLPLTCSAAVYLAWAAGFWAWQVYRPVWCRVSLGMLSKLEYGSSVVTTTAPSTSPPPLTAPVAAANGSWSRTGVPSLSHAMLSGGSPWLTPHTTLVRVPSISPSPGKLKGSITGGTIVWKTKHNRLSIRIRYICKINSNNIDNDN